MRLHGIVCITALLIEMAVSVPVQAAAAGPEQTYPNKPIRLVEPKPPARRSMSWCEDLDRWRKVITDAGVKAV